jgi:cupin fold WbuC family metalloprotein
MSIPATIPRALPHPKGDFFSLNENLLKEALSYSRLSPRKRIMVPIHRTPEASVQRMLNIMQNGSYVRPHLHSKLNGSETICVLQGKALFFQFDDQGTIITSRILTSQPSHCLVDIESNVWHTFFALEPDTILLEIKFGPYDAKHDKTFPLWAPEEESSEGIAYMQRLIESVPI